VEIKLPVPLVHLANRPHGRYRLSAPAGFCYRGDEVAAQAASGAVRYDISYDPARGRWYIDASWKAAPTPPAPLDALPQGQPGRPSAGRRTRGHDPGVDHGRDIALAARFAPEQRVAE
jgi:hypothetical protein